MHKGFVLIEFIIYFVLSTLVIMIACLWMARVQKPLKDTALQQQKIAGLYIAQDLFVRDIAQAQSLGVFWKETGPHCVIWRASDTDVGWELEHNKLIRTQGVYNVKTKKWQAKTRSVVTSFITQATFELISETLFNQEQVRAVSYSFDTIKGQAVVHNKVSV